MKNNDHKTANSKFQLVTSRATKLFKKRKSQNEKYSPKTLFSEEEIAFEEKIRKSWEYRLTRFLVLILPSFTNKRINEITQKVKKSSPLSESINYRFVNYHSLAIWFRSLRKFFSIAYSIIIAVIFLVLAVITFLYWAITNNYEQFLMNPNSTGISFTAPETGDFVLEINNPNPNTEQYVVMISGPITEKAISSLSYGNVSQVDFGNHYISQIKTSDEQHMYSINGLENETFLIDIDYWYGNHNLIFSILDSEMNLCDSLELFDTDVHFLTCETQSDSRLYLLVEPVQGLSSLPTQYGFSSYQIIDLVDNNNISNSTETNIGIGSLIFASLNPNNNIEFDIHLEGGTTANIVVISNNALPISIFRVVEDYSELVAYSTNPIEMDSRVVEIGENTTYSKAYFLSKYFESIGFDIAPKILFNSFFSSTFNTQVDFDPTTILILELLFFLIAFGYFFFFYMLSVSKYDESALVKETINLVSLLQDDDILKSETTKSEIRAALRIISERVIKISRIYQFPIPKAPPPSMEKQLQRIAAQISAKIDDVSLSNENTLSNFQNLSIDWVNIFLESRYGDFECDEGIELPHRKWYRRIIFFISKHLFLIVCASFIISIIFFLTQQYWLDYSNYFFIHLVTIFRYIILIISVYLFYNFLSKKMPLEESKWGQLIRFVLFFFIPLFLFDVVLKTGLVDWIIQLFSSIKLF